jgi:hypothetical protein
MQLYKDITVAIATLFALAMATGHGQRIDESILSIRKQALSEVRKPWGCPSIFNRNACTRYDGAIDPAKSKEARF